MMKYILLAPIFVITLTGCSLASSPASDYSRAPQEQTKNVQPPTENPIILNEEPTSTKATEEDQAQENLMEKYSEAILRTNLGDITLAFYSEESPKTVENFMKLAQSGFYDGVKFHRVIKNFMIQSGDPLSKDDSMKSLWGTGGPGYKFADEINDKPLVRGSLAMANSGPDTNGSQFFIVTADATPWLDGKHTNFGYVVDGMDVVTKIGAVKTEGPDRPIQDVTIESVELR